MGQVTITIDKREYAITCDDGQEGHIIKLSRMLDEKARLLVQSIGSVNENMMLAMVGLLLADEIEDMQKQADSAAAPVLQKADASLAESINRTTEKLQTLIKDIHAI